MNRPQEWVQRLRHWHAARPFLLVVGVVALYFVTTRRAPAPEGWLTDYDLALVEAAATDRKLLVAFNMKGCPACTMMDRTVLADTEVQSALKAFVPVRIDVDREQEIASRFRVFATPTYAIVSTEGTLLDQCQGIQPTEKFLSFLGRVSPSSTRHSP